MGAGASAASMPLEERRKLYVELRSKYTRSDLDELAEEEKQAWLEVVEEGKETEAVAATVMAGGAGEVVREAKVDEEARESLSVTVPEVTVRRAAEAAAARTGASGGRKSGWDLSGKDENAGVRPQGRQTRLSYLLPADSDDENDGGGGGNVGGGGGGGCAATGPGEGQEGSHDAADVEGGVATRHKDGGSSSTSGGEGGGGGRRVSAELPAWKKTAEAVETPNELCVGDVVRARDKECNGMWFEGVLVAIHDETTFQVEISGSGDDEEEEEEDGGGPQIITVGIDDVVRVMPWFCIEVGDMVECLPEGTMGWVRGTVVNIDLLQAVYEVALDSEDFDEEFDVEERGKNQGADGGPTVEELGADGEGKSAEERHFLVRLPDSRVRKIASNRQAATKRWKKVYLASCLTGLGRYIRSKKEESQNCASVE